MKIVNRPLSDLNKTSNKSSNTKGTFDKMLGQHLDVARGKVSPINQSQGMMNQLKGVGDGEFDFADNLEGLKDMDAEYYNKGLRKKTLAETFSARNTTKLESRINRFQHIIATKAKKYNLDPNLLAGLIKQESNFNPYAVSHCGAMGLGQLMPETARYLGVTDPFNAAQNIDGAAKYLREQLDNFGGSTDKALAAYNAGPGAVKRHGGIPPYKETQNYVRSIRSHVNQISKLDVFTPGEVKKKV
ncbi:MAG: lytic transglycosylase domain-containing protein [bacterium]